MDPLTGFPNRRDFVPRCEAQLLRSSFEQRPSVLLLLDVYPLKRLRGNWRNWFAPETRRIDRYLLQKLA